MFFVGYLLFQAVYPTVPWFIGGDMAFTWRMFSGYDADSQFIVVNDDGTEHPIVNALRFEPRATVRVLGPEVDQPRFLPPWLCARWSGAKSVVVRDRMADEAVIPCRSTAP